MAGTWRGGEKVIPDLLSDPEGTRELNLTVLRRLDPAVTDILHTAGHVATYTFNADAMEWRRKPVQGTLFVVKRSEHPKFQLVVMNRLNTENLVEDLLTDFEYDVQVPYVMYRNAANEIIGIWFYDPQECHEVAHIFNRLHYAFSRASPKANCASKSDVEEPEVAPTVHTAEDTLEQSTSPNVVPDDTKDEFLEAFSRAAACVGDTTGGTDAAGSHQSFHSPPSHQPRSASASLSSALHNLLPSRNSSVHMRPFDANISHKSFIIEPPNLVEVNPTLLPPMTVTETTMPNVSSSSLSALPPLHPHSGSHQSQSVALHHHPFPLPIASPFDANISHKSSIIEPPNLVEVNPTFLPPMTATQTTMANVASSSLSVLPPLHPHSGSHPSQSVPLHHHPFPLPIASPCPPSSMPLLQPFRPPKPSPLLNPTAFYVSALTRDQVRGALMRLAQNDDFIDVVCWEIAKRPFP